MATLILNQSDVARLLPMRECIEAVAGALARLAGGEVILPLRPVMWLPERVGALAMMPCYEGESRMVGLKVITVFPGNQGTPYDTHQGAVLLFEATNGRLLAVADASEITAIRTGAASAVATRLLARQDAGDLAILGSGTQARAHLEAMHEVRPIRRVRVWSRNPDHARRFAAAGSEAHGVEVEVAESAEQAVSGADLICTTTASSDPVLRGAWVAAGAHVNAVGAAVPSARELDTDLVARSRFYVDRRESAQNEAGDFLIPRDEGAVSDDHIVGEIGEVLLGKVPGRMSPGDVTVFKSLGIAVEDLASIHHLWRKAQEAGAGVSVELGGMRPGD